MDEDQQIPDEEVTGNPVDSLRIRKLREAEEEAEMEFYERLAEEYMMGCCEYCGYPDCYEEEEPFEPEVLEPVGD